MKIKDITECGFYMSDDTDVLYEVYNNCDFIENFSALDKSEQEKLCKEKVRPYSKFIMDVWNFEYEDLEGIKHWISEGLVYTPEYSDYHNIEVHKAKGKYKVLDTQVNAGCELVEDKLTYKQQLNKIMSICDKASTKSTIVYNGNQAIELKDTQKLAIRILKIIQC